jgi:hypothetical protein
VTEDRGVVDGDREKSVAVVTNRLEAESILATAPAAPPSATRRLPRRVSQTGRFRLSEPHVTLRGFGCQRLV